MSQALPWLTVAALTSWLASGAYLALARTRGWGKAVRRDGPTDHLGKQGTPTMGGVAFLAVTLTLASLSTLMNGTSAPNDVSNGTWAVLALTLAAALLGLWDDATSLTRKRRALRNPMPSQGGVGRDEPEASTGVLARWRILAQTAVALTFAMWVVREGVTMTGMGWLDVPALTFVVVGSINAFNFTDGLDGLAAGITAIILLAFLHDPTAVILLGALLGFLWFNAHPARLFMGGVGSEALGAAIAGLAIVHGDVWRLPILALIPVAEVVSVIVQVGYFRVTGGKRLLKMSPLHHHFELSGWPETQVVLRFWIVTGLLVALAMALREVA